jgi:hypothetical protein
MNWSGREKLIAACSALPAVVWVPLASAVALGIPGVIALLTHQLFLVPSLGPTAMIMTHHPELRSAQPYNAVVGHFVGLGAGFLCVFLLGLSGTPSIFALHSVGAPRVEAAVLAMALASALELVLRAQHPPGAATTLLAALGSFRPTWHDCGAVLGGVIAVVAAAGLLERLRSRAQDRP